MKLHLLFQKLLSKLKNKKNLVYDNLDPNAIKLNLGCGKMYINGWINIDVDKEIKSDLSIQFTDIILHFNENTIDEIMMLHSISYLNLWEARIFFKDLYLIMKKNGRLIIEFPDIFKCCTTLIKNNNKDFNTYIEAVRGIYAFDLDQIKNKDKYIPYSFGWSAEHITRELSNIGFSFIKTENPKSHGELLWRDTRIVAIK
jgi:hypothetical protein